jgi:hypothetical protein
MAKAKPNNVPRKLTKPLSAVRALSKFESLVPGLKTFLVENDGAAPHLKIGEYAVVDTADCELQHGELFLIQYGGGERVRALMQARSDHLTIGGPDADPEQVWWVGDLAGFRKTSERAPGGIPIFAGLSGGPYRTEALQDHLIGRVVGYAFSSLGELLAPTAGYENEEGGNAAFDPAEYIDVLLAAGYRPGVFYDEKARARYIEMMPERRQTEAQEKAVWAAREKFCAASTAVQRVTRECVRRGLINRGSTA